MLPRNAGVCLSTWERSKTVCAAGFGAAFFLAAGFSALAAEPSVKGYRTSIESAAKRRIIFFITPFLVLGGMLARVQWMDFKTTFYLNQLRMFSASFLLSASFRFLFRNGELSETTTTFPLPASLTAMTPNTWTGSDGPWEQSSSMSAHA